MLIVKHSLHSKSLLILLYEKSILLIFLSFATLFTTAQTLEFAPKTTIYLVRHAEKDTGNNPSLTQQGFKRAGDLQRFLNNVNISHIYSTKYKRTNQTADSLKLVKNLSTIIYEADTIGNDLVKKIKDNGDDGKKILVVGHSNTVPKLIRRLGVNNYTVENLGDNEFDNLFIVTYKKRKIKFTQKKYGQLSGSSAKMN